MIMLPSILTVIVSFSSWLQASTHRVSLFQTLELGPEAVTEECAGLSFTHDKEPFARGHGGGVKVFQAETGDEKDLIWKADRRAGPSAECSILNRLHTFGMSNSGCVKHCESGLLVRAVIDPRTGKPAPNLLKEVSQWAQEGKDLLSLATVVLPEFLQEVEKMMLAGIVNLDQNIENVLIQGDDLQVALIDFGVFEGSVVDFSTWESIPSSYKVAMFGSQAVSLAFCGPGALPQFCQASIQAARTLLEAGLTTVQFKQPETRELAAQGLRQFTKVGAFDLVTAFDMMQKKLIDPAVIQVAYRNHWDNPPSKDLTFEQTAQGLTVKQLLGNRAKISGVKPECRLIGWKVDGQKHDVQPDTSIEQLDQVHTEGNIVLLFTFP